MMGKLVSTTVTGQQEGIALQTLVSRLVAGIVPIAARHKSFMVNEIPAGLNLVGNTEIIASVLNDVFATMASYAENSCIRISAKMYGYLVVVQLTDNNNPGAYTIASNLQEVLPIAEKIGGYIGITSQRETETTVVFSFPNVPLAA